MLRKNLAGEMVGEFGLCENRHDYPVKECIYPETISRMNFARLELTAMAVLSPLVKQGLKALIIYASGCTEAILAVYSAALKLHINNFTVMHYDPLYENYAAQPLTAFNDLYMEKGE